MKTFRLVSISQNTNSFGLYGFIWLAEDGTAYEVGGNHLKHALYRQRLDDKRFEGFPERTLKLAPGGTPYWTADGWEISKLLPRPHRAVIDSVWPKAG